MRSLKEKRMKTEKPMKLLSTSLVKLDFTLEEILLELSAMSAKLSSKDAKKLLEEYEELSEDADRLRKKAEKLIKKNSKKHLKSKNNKNVSFIDSVDFTQVQDVDISDTVGKLPVQAKLFKNNICDVDIEVVKPNLFVIKKGSIICKSNNKNVNEISSQEIKKLRQKIMSDKTYAKEMIPSGFSTFKYILKKDIKVESVYSIFNIVYGRKSSSDDTLDKIKVQNKDLSIYLKTGNVD